jgi:serine/threonine-protein kinase RsbW
MLAYVAADRVLSCRKLKENVMREDPMGMKGIKKERQSLTFEESTSTLPSSLLSAVDDWHTNIARTALADSTTSRMTFTLDSSLDSVNKIEQTAEQTAQRAGFDEDTIPHIAMAVREAAVNAVLHGNAYDQNKHVTASFETTSDSLIIRIADQGPGLDPNSIPDPLAPENILRGSGRGIFLIRAFMDEVNFRQLHPGTELTLIKHRTPAQSGT